MIVLSVFLMGNLFAATDPVVPKRAKPNIIFILADDLGYGDVGLFFQNKRREAGKGTEPWLSTPRLDELASAGAMLTQHYAPAPVCAPSRASLMLGVSQGHSNIRDNQFDKALADNYTLANVAKKSGYATAAIGKWGMQGKDAAWPAQPLNRGFDYFFGYMRHVDGHEHYPKEGVYRGAKEVWQNRTELSKDLDKCYTTDLWTAAAKDWIVNQKKNKEDQPFFMLLAYDSPHAVLELPTQAYPKGGGLKGGLQWRGEPGHMINTAFGEVDSWIHPDYVKATYDDDKDASTPAVAWPDTYKRYATMVRRLDDAVGDVMQLLKDLKIDSNTLVVFTSDNGPERLSFLPKENGPAVPTFFDSFGPFDGIKRDVLEGGIRVPAIAYWNGRIPAGKVVESPGIFYDWMPTFCDAMGVSTPVRTDGVSLMPSLTGVGQQKNSLVYVEYFETGTTPGYAEFAPEHRNQPRKQMQMIRMGDTVGVRYNIQSAADDFGIYDVKRDPQQKNNLAKGQEVLQGRMKERVLQMRRPDSEAPRPYDAAYVPALRLATTKSGLKLTEYLVSAEWIPKTDGLQGVYTSTVPKPQLRANAKGNLFFYEGYVKIPEDGEYTFYISSSGRSFLRIHDAIVIDQDYAYQRPEPPAKIKLQAGYHPVRLYFMKGADSGKPVFSFEWSKNNGEKAALPSHVFFH